MKVRTDFVTNSSSSSFICLRLPTGAVEAILEQNDLSSEKILQRMDDGDYDDIELRDRYLEAVLGECGLDYVGWTLDENDLTEHNLAELREMLSKEIKSVYKMDVSPNNLIFDFGEIYRWKIRSDFVTNSSSSSFVIAYKTNPDIPSDVAEKYPEIKYFTISLKHFLLSDAGYETTTGDRCTTKGVQDSWYLDTEPIVEI